jgi:GAF domain-containing protein/PAS domain-containing protein
MADGEGAGRRLPGQGMRLDLVRERVSALRAGTEALMPRIIDLAALERESAAASLDEMTHHLRAVEDELSDLVLAVGDFDDNRVPPVRMLFVEAPLPYIVTDAHGVILVANEAAGALLVRRPEDLPGVPIAGFSGPPPGALRRMVTAAAASTAPRSASLSLRSPHRSPRQMRTTVQRLATGPTGPVLLWQLHPAPAAEPVPLAKPAPADAIPTERGRPREPYVAERIPRADDPAAPEARVMPRHGQCRAGAVGPASREAADRGAPGVEVPDPAPRAALPGALVDAVLELASTLIAEVDLPDALARVAEVAVRGVPVAEGASVTLLDPPSSGASDDRVARADRVQFDEQNGPGVTVVEEGRTVVADDIASDPRWTASGPRVAVESGFRAVLVVPLVERSAVLGVLTLYAATPGAFDPGAVAGAELLAAPAEARVANVRAYLASLHVAEELRHGLVSRAVIDQAKGILMVQHGLTADQAFAVLTRFSQQENRKLREVAADLVDSSVRESRRRQSGGSIG